MSENDLDLLLREIRLLWGQETDRPAVAVGVAGPTTPAEPPAALLMIKDALGARLPTSIVSCFSYLVDPAPEPAAPPGITLHRSTEPPSALLRAARPEPQWEPGEWTDLLDGRLGPWVIALAGDRVTALCHSPRDRDGAAEVGVWTDPDHRGRGYAVVVTAAWAHVAGVDHPWLYYSHFDDNHASAAVARKLGARPIGRIWQLRSVDSSVPELAPDRDH
jgi:RimJ/RimL family protein N-acetyltransferase